MPRLLLVRHAAPRVDPSVPPADWVLSRAGEEAATGLARNLTGLSAGQVYCSPETKAVQTARAIAEEWGAAVRIDEHLAEVKGRSWAHSRAEYEGLAGRYLRGEGVDGWEKREDAQMRTVNALATLMKSSRDVAVVSHGLVLVLCLAWLQGVDAGTLDSVWRSIRFPDLCIVDWTTRQIVRPFGRPL